MVELVWDGKYVDGKRAEPQRAELPFQTVETVNESNASRQQSLALARRGEATQWRNRLIWGDKKFVLPSLLPEFSGQVNLIYIDPPFDSGTDFSIRTKIPGTKASVEKHPSLIEQKAYRDTWGVSAEEARRGVTSVDKYLRWFWETALLFKQLLSEKGLLVVHVDDNVVHEVKLVLDEVFGGNNFRGEIIWKLDAGAKSKKFFSIQHNTLLVYSGTDTWTFNHAIEQAREPYAKGSRTTHFRNVDENGQRFREEKRNGKTYRYDEANGRLRGSVWTDISSMRANSPIIAESTPYPTQKPLGLLERVIAVCSNKGDLILDCFCGSGTTPVAAEKLGRRWIACDVGRFAIHTTRKRLLDLADLRPFQIQNLGKYERELWKADFSSPQEAVDAELAYRNFVLELYGGNAHGGHSWVHGVKDGAFIHIGAVDAPVTVDDVRAMAAEVEEFSDASSPAQIRLEILGWDFAFEVVEISRELKGRHCRTTFKRIPREIVDSRTQVQPADFFELRAVASNTEVRGLHVEVKLAEFIIPSEDLPTEVAKAVKHWSQWIDFWAVDWDFRDDTFHNTWQSYRTRKDNELVLLAKNEYSKPGTYKVMIKVIDLMGCDTTKLVEVQVK